MWSNTLLFLDTLDKISDEYNKRERPYNYILEFRISYYLIYSGYWMNIALHIEEAKGEYKFYETLFEPYDQVEHE